LVNVHVFLLLCRSAKIEQTAIDVAIGSHVHFFEISKMAVNVAVAASRMAQFVAAGLIRREVKHTSSQHHERRRVRHETAGNSLGLLIQLLGNGMKEVFAVDGLPWPRSFSKHELVPNTPSFVGAKTKLVGGHELAFETHSA